MGGSFGVFQTQKTPANSLHLRGSLCAAHAKAVPERGSPSKQPTHCLAPSKYQTSASSLSPSNGVICRSAEITDFEKEKEKEAEKPPVTATKPQVLGQLLMALLARNKFSDFVQNPCSIVAAGQALFIIFAIFAILILFILFI